ALIDHVRGCGGRLALAHSTLWRDGRGVRYSAALRCPGHSTLRHAAMGVSLEGFVERYSPAADRRGNRACSRARLPHITGRNCRTSHQRCGFFGSLRRSVVAAPLVLPPPAPLSRSLRLPPI